MPNEFGRVRVYGQLGGFGGRMYPVTLQPGMGSTMEAITKRGLLPHVHNSFNATSKPVLPYFGTALSEPLFRRAVHAGITDIRATMYTMPETVVSYYMGRSLGTVNGKDVSVRKFLYEPTKLDTSGSIIRDVAASIRDGSLKADDTVLVLGGDIRAEIDMKQFLEEHWAKHADISIALASVPREEMYRFGAAVRAGDNTEELAKILMNVTDKGRKTAKNFSVFGELKTNSDTMATITRFLEKMPKLNPNEVIDTGGHDIQQIFSRYGVGALAPTNLQNGSIYAIRAGLLDEIAPLVFNLSPDAPATEWSDCVNINLGGPTKFSDFGGDHFMVFTGSKPFPQVDKDSPTAQIQQALIEKLQKALPAIYGFKLEGKWADDGTLPALLAAQREILDEFVEKGRHASWPINWDQVKSGYRRGIITMSALPSGDSVTIIPPVYIGQGVVLKDGAVVGPYAVIGEGWEISGKVSNSMLSPRRRIDRQLHENGRTNRLHVPSEMEIDGSIIASGFQDNCVDETGKIVDMTVIKDSVVVDNGATNVKVPINI